MSLEKAIKKTVDYAAKFRSHINKKEIEQRLISKNIFSRKKIEKTLDTIGFKNKKNKWKQLKIKKAQDLAELLAKKFKNILMIGITGSVASGHPKKNDDIDLMIITRSDTLWKTRLELRWWIYKNKIPHRTFGKKEMPDQFCFNLWLDEKSLKLPEDKQNLQNAVDLVLLKTLINKNKIYEKFIRENSWAKKFVATGYFKLVNRSSIIDRRENKNFILDEVINWCYFWPQYWYMKGKIYQEKVGLHQAFFHRPMIK